jgi:hypothetical protein
MMRERIIAIVFSIGLKDALDYKEKKLGIKAKLL